MGFIDKESSEVNEKLVTDIYTILKSSKSEVILPINLRTVLTAIVGLYD